MSVKIVVWLLLQFLIWIQLSMVEAQNNISFVLSLRLFGRLDSIPKSSAVAAVAEGLHLGFQINSIVLRPESFASSVGDPLCVYNSLAYWDADVLAEGDADHMAAVLAVPSSFMTMRLSFLKAFNQGGIPTDHLYGRFYSLSNINTTTPASILRVGKTLRLFKFWMKVEGSANLLPVPMCHSTTFVALWAANTTSFAYPFLTINVTQMIRVGSGMAAPSPSSAARRMLPQGGDVVYMEMETQTSDPDATQESLEEFFQPDRLQAMIAQLQSQSAPVTSVSLVNVTIFQGLAPLVLVSSSAIPSSLPSPATAPKAQPGIDGIKSFNGVSGVIDMNGINASPSIKGTEQGGGHSIGLILGIVALAIVLGKTSMFGVYMWRRRQKSWHRCSTIQRGPPSDGGFPSLNREDVEICQYADGGDWMLGAGSYGQVYKGCLGNEYVAIKRLYPHAAHCISCLFQNEVKILTMASYGDHVVQLFGVVPAASSSGGKERSGPLLVMELMEMGDLCALIREDLRGEFSWFKKGKRVALDVARGMAFLHTLKIIHRDLKSSNIFINKSGVAKIGDVGLARVMSTSMVNHSGGPAGTFDYTAPELLLGGDYSEKVDCYSFGVLLWEIVARETPRRGKLHSLKIPDECPPEIDALIKACIMQDPEGRPTAMEIVQFLLGHQ